MTAQQIITSEDRKQTTIEKLKPNVTKLSQTAQ
jgi:hypothetical protein